MNNARKKIEEIKTFSFLFSERSECQLTPGVCESNQVCLSNGHSGGIACLCDDKGKLVSPSQLLQQLQQQQQQQQQQQSHADTCKDLLA
jgi:hypothetical protein